MSKSLVCIELSFNFCGGNILYMVVERPKERHLLQ